MLTVRGVIKGELKGATDVAFRHWPKLEKKPNPKSKIKPESRPKRARRPPGLAGRTLLGRRQQIVERAH